MPVQRLDVRGWLREADRNRQLGQCGRHVLDTFHSVLIRYLACEVDVKALPERLSCAWCAMY